MIRQFDTNTPILFFPANWANSVAQWIGGLMSPTGTININNTLNPSSSGSCSLDVNIEVLWQILRERIAAEFALKSEIGKIVGEQSDTSLKYSMGGLGVDVDAVDIETGGGGTTVNGYTGTVTGVPYGTGTATTTMYFKDGLRYYDSGCTTLYSGTQTLGGETAWFTNGKLYQYNSVTVTSRSQSVTCGTFTFYWNYGYLKSVNGSPY